jgi:hypothetical protein
MRRSTSHIAVQRCRSVGGLLPLLVGSVLITLLATAAGPTSSGWLFQSPVSPISPSPGVSPAAPQETVTGPALVSVPAVPNFLPWVIGLLVVVAVVVVAMWWRGRREEGGASE